MSISDENYPPPQHPPPAQYPQPAELPQITPTRTYSEYSDSNIQILTEGTPREEAPLPPIPPPQSPQYPPPSQSPQYPPLSQSPPPQYPGVQTFKEGTPYSSFTQQTAPSSYGPTQQLNMSPVIIVDPQKRSTSCESCGSNAAPLLQSRLSNSGWVAVLILIFCCFPCAWIPCVMDQCYDKNSVCPVCGRPR